MAVTDDLDGDDLAELMLQFVDVSAEGASVRTFLASGVALDAADSADGTADRVIAVDHESTFLSSWAASDLIVTPAGDSNGDGLGDLVFRSPMSQTWYLVYGKDVMMLSGAIEEDDLDNTADVWKFIEVGKEGCNSWCDFLPAGDVDNDGRADMLFLDVAGGVVSDSDGHLVLASDLAVLDAADGAIDRSIRLHNVAGDTDGDGIRNIADPDDDGDGVADACDPDPLIPDATDLASSSNESMDC